MPGTDPVLLIADPQDPQALADQVRASARGEALPPLHLVRGPHDLTAPAREAQILLSPPQLAAALLPHLPALRWVQCTWAGVTPILQAMAGHPNPDLTLTAAKGLFGPRMAEYVFGWLLTLERQLITYEKLKVEGRWERLGWRDLRGRTLLLLGTGSIGVHLAGVAEAFGMRVQGVSRRGAPVAGIPAVRPVSQLRDALAEADYVVASLPDTPATRNLLDAPAFAAMRQEAILINVGRGTLIDDDALLRALQARQLRAAVLDVFRDEPLPPSHPFWAAQNLHLTPHVAAFTPEDGIVTLFCDNLQRYLQQQPLLGAVDREAGY